MKKIKIVIPARYGSSRLEGKPMLEISNKPIFWHVHKRCIEAGFSKNDIYLATDDDRIYQKSLSLNLNTVMTSSQHESGTDRIYEVSRIKGWEPQDIVINVQGDEPMISPTLIRQLAEFSAFRTEFDITTAVVSIDSFSDFENPNVVKAVVGLHNRALYFTRSAAPYKRDTPTAIDLAFKHIGIYAYTVQSLSKFCSFDEAPLEAYEKLEQLRALSNGLSIGALYYDGEVAHGVDTLSDYQKVKNRMEAL
ncbi:3-deoxy-manno-octulosonate cytidylyltransferase [Providencia rettgeri]|uniref:3-deoxy-manno-octulosonate cytidylyltransferase n=1 Tax=Providencia rettgeri TaxID=587 RepID=UPI0023621E46|nr:3-deoxy-manno-octulosonate cytidylyltransferase [Providencia rettgeri]EMB5787643.1 3-deoxy-manno-octulosonate cytidylyltransferase [Providencia rettgeri]